jgi:hypothetical protein
MSSRELDVSLAEALAQPEGADAPFDPPRIGGGIFKPADLELRGRHGESPRWRPARSFDS